MTDSNESLAGSAEANGSAEGGTDESESDGLPADVVDEAERLTRLKRTVPDENEARVHAERRTELLEDHDFTARIRDDDGDDVLVLHPDEWHEDGVIRTDRVDDISRAVEIRLEGSGDPDDWETVDAHNRELVADVRERHGDIHGDNTTLLADFVGNHYAKRIEELTGDELEEFRTEYVVRNAWPSAAQRDAIEESIALVYETAGEPVPNEQVR